MSIKLEKESRKRTIVKYQHFRPVTRQMISSLVLLVFLDSSRVFVNAKTNSHHDFYSSSGELIDVFRMERDLVRITY